MTRSHVTLLPKDADGRAIICCRAARRHEERGEHELALEVLSPFWQGPPTVPALDHLSIKSQASVLVRAGSITGWLGGQRRAKGWQDLARDLLGRGAALAQRLHDLGTWSEAQKHIAISYWREGAFDEARVVLSEAIAKTDSPLELALNLGIVERCAGRLEEALSIYHQVARDVEGSSDYLRALFHNGLGLVLKALNRVDDAFIEFTAAGHFFRECENLRYEIIAEINLANLSARVKEFAAAHQHLDRVERLAKDPVHLAQAKDSRATVLIEQGDHAEAEVAALQSVQLLERGEEYALLVDSLVTYARTLMCCQRNIDAYATYVRAQALARERLSDKRAAEIALELSAHLAAEVSLSGYTTHADMMRSIEGAVVKAVLRDSGANVSRAALRLGLSQQTLSYMLATRHKDIRPGYSVGRPRKNSKRADADSKQKH